jgi:hypothetical protein
VINRSISDNYCESCSTLQKLPKPDEQKIWRVNERLPNIERLVYNINVDANLANQTKQTEFRTEATVRSYCIGMIMHSIGLLERRDKSYINFEVIGVVT